MKFGIFFVVAASVFAAACAHTLHGPLVPQTAAIAAAPQMATVGSANRLPPDGVSVIEPDWKATILSRGKMSEFGGAEASPTGLKLVTVKQPEHSYNLQAHLQNTVPLRKGDTLFIRFSARSLQADKLTGATKLLVSYSKATPAYDISYKGEIGLTSAWQRFDIPFTCANDFAANEARLTFTFGYVPQTAEIADVQVLKFGPEVIVSSLPKTKRYADPVSPEKMKSEIARIVGLKKALAAQTNPAPANGKTINVAKNGAANGDGTSAKPFVSIPQALAVVQPGDTILVGAGEYREINGVGIKKSGRPDAWIKIHAAPNTRPKIISSGWSGFDIRGGIGYVEISGFEVEWIPDPSATAPVYGSGIALAYATHHIRVLNNVVHGFGTGGIGTLDCDYVTFEGNTVYNTAKTSPYGGSAIGLCRAFNFDDAPSYHNVIRRNICFDNELTVATLPGSGGNGRVLTDGNGIIIDSLIQSRANPLKPHYDDRNGPLLPYRGRTLIENNLIYDNGGRGIHVFRSEKVDIINNTCYMNQKSADINGGELTSIESNDVTLLNNIAYGRKEKRANTQDGSRGTIWANNLLFNSDDVLLHQGVIVSDPLFVAPGLDAKPDGFRLQKNSPAKGKAVAAVAPLDDLAGSPRPPKGPIDLGAYQIGMEK